MKTHEEEDERGGFRPPLGFVPFEVQADLAAWAAVAGPDDFGDFEPMVVGTMQFDIDEKRVAMLRTALEESLDDDVIEDFDHEAFARDLNERWRNGEI